MSSSSNSLSIVLAIGSALVIIGSVTVIAKKDFQVQEIERDNAALQGKLTVSELSLKQAIIHRDAHQKRFDGLLQPLLEKESAICAQNNGSLLSFGEIQSFH